VANCVEQDKTQAKKNSHMMLIYTMLIIGEMVNDLIRGYASRRIDPKPGRRA
jgi:hypothetical protein